MESREMVGGTARPKPQTRVPRYIRLTELIPELLDMVDEKKIAFNPAYELSFLKKEEQTQLAGRDGQRAGHPLPLPSPAAEKVQPGRAT